MIHQQKRYVNKLELSVLVQRAFQNKGTTRLYGYHNYKDSKEEFSFPIIVVAKDSQIDRTKLKEKQETELIVKGILKFFAPRKQYLLIAQGIEYV